MPPGDDELETAGRSTPAGPGWWIASDDRWYPPPEPPEPAGTTHTVGDWKPVFEGIAVWDGQTWVVEPGPGPGLAPVRGSGSGAPVTPSPAATAPSSPAPLAGIDDLVDAEATSRQWAMTPAAGPPVDHDHFDEPAPPRFSSLPTATVAGEARFAAPVTGTTLAGPTANPHVPKIGEVQETEGGLETWNGSQWTTVRPEASPPARKRTRRRTEGKVALVLFLLAALAGGTFLWNQWWHTSAGGTEPTIPPSEISSLH